MKNKYIRHLLHAVVLFIGLILMIGGIITGKHGATVVGIIVAAVDVQQWMKWYKENNKIQN